MPVLTNSLGMEFVLIPAGRFHMGAPQGTEDADTDERPLHEVEITRPFYLGVHLVTQGEYQLVTGTNRSAFRRVARCDTRRFPIEGVSWYDAMAFIQMLSNLPQEKAAGRVYRLPTEAEWEYACRAWFSPEWTFHCGDTLSTAQANIREGDDDEEEGPAFLRRPQVVGSYPPNAFALYDLHGNLAEWCSDWYRPRYYSRCARKDPPGPKSGVYRILRGGAWGDRAHSCRTSRRIHFSPDSRHDALGVRVALTWG
jgi:formylglycine-generating enzyme required for sulfatase activity